MGESFGKIDLKVFGPVFYKKLVRGAGGETPAKDMESFQRVRGKALM